MRLPANPSQTIPSFLQTGHIEFFHQWKRDGGESPGSKSPDSKSKQNLTPLESLFLAAPSLPWNSVKLLNKFHFHFALSCSLDL